MGREEIVMVCCSDIAGQLRGKGFPVRLLGERLARGVGRTDGLDDGPGGGCLDQPAGRSAETKGGEGRQMGCRHGNQR